MALRARAGTFENRQFDLPRFVSLLSLTVYRSLPVKNSLRSACVAVLALVLSGCFSIPVQERDRIRQRLDESADRVLQEFAESDATLAERTKEAPGYMLAALNLDVLAAVARMDGVGLVADNANDTRTYVSISGSELGLGLGSAETMVLAIPESRESLERLKTGFTSTRLVARSVAGKAGGIASTRYRDIDLYFMSESGAAVSTTATRVRVAVIEDLTETGLGDIRVPTIGAQNIDRQGDTAPRTWSRPLPFLGQQVVDQGFDLPLPFGVGMAFAAVEQPNDITQLRVGFGDGPKVPYEWVAFENTLSDTDSWQLKLDAWVFPFLQVFALYGEVDGTVSSDVFLDGNGLIDFVGLDCTRLVNRPLCSRLEDQLVLLPIRTSIDVKTYGGGITLATGWRNFFFAVPATVTYTEPRLAVTDGKAITITPRAGFYFELPRFGNLALFAGGNYLDSDLDVDGVFNFGDGFPALDFSVRQANTDSWNAVLGFNWDVSRRLGISAEYNGFTGSRESFISAITYRF